MQNGSAVRSGGLPTEFGSALPALGQTLIPAVGSRDTVDDMDPDVIVAIDVPQVGDDRHKSWAKVVTFVDVSRSTGWAFEGDFIATGGIQDVAAGSVIVVYGQKGSRANPTPHAAVYRAHPDGTVSLEGEAKGRAWARTLRDTVQRLLEDDGQEPLTALEWQPDLMRYSDAALEEELHRRSRA